MNLRSALHGNDVSPLRPSRLEVLEYAKEGLSTLIGTGSGYEYAHVLEEYERHREWIEHEIRRITASQQQENEL